MAHYKPVCQRIPISERYYVFVASDYA